MNRVELTSSDLARIQAHGLDVAEVEKQVGIFEKGAPYVNLDRPCTVGDGIKRLSDPDLAEYIRMYEHAAGRREVTKFVPASGAATRMFRALLKIANDHEKIEYDAIAALAGKKDGDYAEVRTFMDNIERFAFYESLRSRMKYDGYNLEELRRKGDFTQIIDYVLTDKGLGYASKPKGLIQFHKDKSGARTAFEEHLVEAAAYVKDRKGICRLHFTVSPEHRAGFEGLLRRVEGDYESANGIKYDVDFSEQSMSTDTIAVDMENRPFRDPEGNLVFRPGGHGALIGNLNRLAGDVIFIKNVDNVVPDRLKDETHRWKKVLGGYLVMIEEKIREMLDRIAGEDAGQSDIEAAAAFVKNELCIGMPEHLENAPPEEQRPFLKERLQRPLRVCGMVPSTGEPGGGPFWVKDREGGTSIQIVENAQIDPGDPDQQAILKRLTHFNPVDIVASVRERSGNPYDLHQYVDHEAVFISVKSRDGRDLKALEHPGLWNGGMAKWNTIFVEVPLITFNPVKTVNDLLRDEHQG
ncbi:MAG: DUF4301 family protein [Desulfobacterales bacterium]|nr:DUF4301 family protein [Desulfobacterales bacterium]MBS3755823.1 DUF4301 family protein [Desulfobacterales bacterium]